MEGLRFDYFIWVSVILQYYNNKELQHLLKMYTNEEDFICNQNFKKLSYFSLYGYHLIKLGVLSSCSACTVTDKSKISQENCKAKTNS